MHMKTRVTIYIDFVPPPFFTQSFARNELEIIYLELLDIQVR